MVTPSHSPLQEKIPQCERGALRRGYGKSSTMYQFDGGAEKRKRQHRERKKYD